MHITIATAGTRGDVQPYLALGKGLQRAGHAVAVATDPAFATFIEASGLTFAPVSADPRQALQEDIRRLTNPVSFSRWVQRQFGPLARRYTAELLLRPRARICSSPTRLLSPPSTWPNGWAFRACPPTSSLSRRRPCGLRPPARRSRPGCPDAAG